MKIRMTIQMTIDDGAEKMSLSLGMHWHDVRLSSYHVECTSSI